MAKMKNVIYFLLFTLAIFGKAQDLNLTIENHQSTNWVSRSEDNFGKDYWNPKSLKLYNKNGTDFFMHGPKPFLIIGLAPPQSWDSAYSN